MKKNLERLLKGFEKFYDIQTKDEYKESIKEEILRSHVSKRDLNVNGSIRTLAKENELEDFLYKKIDEYFDSLRGRSGYALYLLSTLKDKVENTAEISELVLSLNPAATIPVQLGANVVEIPMYLAVQTAYSEARLALGLGSGMYTPDLKGGLSYAKDVILGYGGAVISTIPWFGSLFELSTHLDDPFEKLTYAATERIKYELLTEIAKNKRKEGIISKPIKLRKDLVDIISEFRHKDRVEERIIDYHDSPSVSYGSDLISAPYAAL